MNTTNNHAQGAQNNYEVIDQFFAAQVACNESEATLKSLRPQVEDAVRELIKEQGKPSNFTDTIEYHGFKIIISRPKSFTWEKNTQPCHHLRPQPRYLRAATGVAGENGGRAEGYADGPQTNRREARKSPSRKREYQACVPHRVRGIKESR